MANARKSKLNWTSRGDLEPIPEGVRRLVREDMGVVFQPIVACATGKMFAFEALVRCKHPDYPSPPALFDAAVKEDGCGRVGRLIREVAFATCGEVPLFVNLHPQELSSHWLVQPDDPLGFHPKPVYLEVTEASALTHFDLCMSVLKDLVRRTGAKLVVDDFGAGYSNLERVVELNPSIIKLDLALTRGIHRHPAKQIVVRHMVAMCAELGAKVVAEGVETVEEFDCVKDLGVDYAQGYLLARPASPPPPHAWPLDRSAASSSSQRRSAAPPTKRSKSMPSAK